MGEGEGGKGRDREKGTGIDPHLNKAGCARKEIDTSPMQLMCQEG